MSQESKPTPTVIPDAKGEREPALTDEQKVKAIYPNAVEAQMGFIYTNETGRVLGLGWKSAVLDEQIVNASKLPHESKPLPSEPLIRTVARQIDRHYRKHFLGQHETISGISVHEDVLAEEILPQLLAAKPSEPAEGLATYLRNSDPWDAVKRNESGAAVQVVSQLVRAVWNAAKAEKVEESWPRESVTDKELADEAWNVRAREYQRDIATELQAYRELKKRSVGGVK